MSRDKKSPVDDITKLRKILDNPSDPGTEKLISENEKALHSIRRQLIGKTSRTSQKSDHFLRKFDTLEPKVTIHTKTPVSPQSTISLPSFQPTTVRPSTIQTTTLPEFELVSTAIPAKMTTQLDVLFAQEELYEVEKVEINVPKLSEGTSSDLSEKQPETTMNYNEPSVLDDNLPEWQPVEDVHIKETQEKQSTDKTSEIARVDTHMDLTKSDTSASDTIPEFERLESPTSETIEKPDDLQIPPPAKQLKEEPMAFQLVEPTEVPLLKLMRKQERDAKKAEKRREKEAKKQKKLELKKLKIETREKEREARRLAKEQQSAQYIPDAQPIQQDLISKEKPQLIPIDTTAFNDMETIDEKTAQLLYTNGYFSLETLKDATVDDLVQIRGIKRNLAKQIKKEVQQKIRTPPKPEFIPIKGKTHRAKPKKTSDDIAEWEPYHIEINSEPSVSVDVCVYKGYTLYKHMTRKDKGKKKTIHFFSKEKPEVGSPTSLPDAYRIAINKKTGVPYLKKKK
jgi:hypothetical protein